MSTALVQKCACGGTTLPFHSKTRVRMCLIFMDVSSSEELMAGALAKRVGRKGYMTGGGTTLPFHSKTRVRMCLIFMDVSSSEELMAGPLAKRCGRIGYMTGGRR